MMISGSSGIAAAPALARKYPSQPAGSQQAQKEDKARRFDSVTLSAEGGRPSAREIELRGALRREIRAAGSKSPESIEALREQVRNGTYLPDARETARKMLLMGAV